MAIDLPTLLGNALNITPAAGGLVLTVIILGIVATALLSLKASTLIVLVLLTAVTAVLYLLNWAPLWLIFVEFIALVVTLAITVKGGGEAEPG